MIHISTFRVLMICTANYCRSPIAEQLRTTATKARFGAANTWLRRSAGTHISDAYPIHEFAAQVLAQRQAFIEGHQSRMLDATMLREADLVLTSTRSRRSLVARTLSAAIGRTFTMLQFARPAAAASPIQSSDAGELGRRLLVKAKAARGQLQPVPPEQDDLPDPMGRPTPTSKAAPPPSTSSSRRSSARSTSPPRQIPTPATASTNSTRPREAVGKGRAAGPGRSPPCWHGSTSQAYTKLTIPVPPVPNPASSSMRP